MMTRRNKASQQSQANRDQEAGSDIEQYLCVMILFLLTSDHVFVLTFVVSFVICYLMMYFNEPYVFYSLLLVNIFFLNFGDKIL